MSRWRLCRLPKGRGPISPASGAAIIAWRCRTYSSAPALPAALSFHNATDASTTEADASTRLRRRKYNDLLDSLSRDAPNPTRVWAYYTELVLYMDLCDIPLEVSQSVLRKCVPPTEELRISHLTRLRAGRVPRNPHMYEHRLQTIIGNIKAAGMEPTLEDYHFVLEQFAAVGHYVGSRAVFQELVASDLQLRSKSCGLYLQALVHCLALPCSSERRPYLIEDTGKACDELLDTMWKQSVRFAPVNVDLVVRVLRERTSIESFEKLLRYAYGIDLSNPDGLPAEYRSKQELSASTQQPQRFSTAALTTVVDLLGRFGEISKMVVAFEVLSQPLPSQRIEYTSHSFDEEDDFGIDLAPEQKPTYDLPRAIPNTTTYAMLIKHICRAGNATLARHYVYEAMERARVADRHLQLRLKKGGYGSAYSINIAVNRGILLPIFGLANRDKNVELMRWALKQCNRTLRRKRAHIWYFSRWLMRPMLPQQRSEASVPLDPGFDTTPSSDIDRSPRQSPSVESTTIRPSPNSTTFRSSLQFRSRANVEQFFTPNSTRSGSNGVSGSSGVALPDTRPKKDSKDPALSAFDVDLDAPEVSQLSPLPTKRFNVETHLEILERDASQVKLLMEHIQFVLGRTIQRIKERLGRRVWAGKDLYLQSDDERVKISKERWIDITGFSPRVSGRPASRGNSWRDNRNTMQSPPHPR